MWQSAWLQKSDGIVPRKNDSDGQLKTGDIASVSPRASLMNEPCVRYEWTVEKSASPSSCVRNRGPDRRRGFPRSWRLVGTKQRLRPTQKSWRRERLLTLTESGSGCAGVGNLEPEPVASPGAAGRAERFVTDRNRDRRQSTRVTSVHAGRSVTS